ncbi:MAG: ABC transporter permease [Chloroflexi bacterium]|nr:ABC transporter permease [Chloroflexota bacterium]
MDRGGAPVDVPSPGPGGTRRQRLAAVAIPAVAFIVLIVVWEIAIRAFRVPIYLAPAPSAILPAIIEHGPSLVAGAWITIQEVIVGFAIAVVLAIPLAYILATSRFMEQALYPIIVFFQLIPKIAVAPLLLIWFGFGMSSKIVLVTVVCFFPVLVDSMTGFKALNPRLLYLTKSMGASPLQTLWYVRLPAAMPFIFSGLKIAAVFATTAAIVGEMIGANSGLGYLLLRGSGNLNTPLVFAALAAMSVIGILCSYLVSAVEWAVMPWQRHRDE